MPVLLAEPTIQIDVGPTIITLDEPALEVKRIQKRLKLWQNTLLQDTNKLFIAGEVHKNIEYSTIDGYSYSNLWNNKTQND